MNVTPDVALAVGVMLAAGVLAWPPSGVPSRLARLASANRALTSPDQRTHAEPTSVPATPLVMELVAAALDAGLPATAAVEAAVNACGPPTQRQLGQVVELWRLGATVDRSWQQAADEWEPLARCLVLAERTGASAATVLRTSAGDLRAGRRRRARVSAHRLGVVLVLPLGLTTLPAFLLWAVVPVVLGLAEQVLSGTGP